MFPQEAQRGMKELISQEARRRINELTSQEAQQRTKQFSMKERQLSYWPQVWWPSSFVLKFLTALIVCVVSCFFN
jgi:hypothetical protein